MLIFKQGNTSLNMSSWSSRASRHLGKLRDAVRQACQTMQLVQLRPKYKQSVLTGAVSQAASVIKQGEQSYLRKESKGMSSTALVVAIANSDRL